MKDAPAPEPRLSRISTTWTDLLPKAEPPSATAEVSQRLLERYGAAVYRYLMGALRDPEAANELFQEFALRFVRGDFRRAAPERGRFRDFLKAVLGNLVADHYRNRQRAGAPLGPGAEDGAAVAAPPGEEADRELLAACREELLARTWAALADAEAQTGRPLHTILRLRVDRPDASAESLATVMSDRLGRPLTDRWVHKWLHHARARFADLLLDQVEATLERPTPENLESELLDLDLLGYCRQALRRRR